MKPLYIHGERAFLILRRVWEGHFFTKLDQTPNLDYVKMYRDWCGADHVLRDQTHFLFCETIPDVEVEEEELALEN